MERFSDLGLHSDVFVAILATLQDSTTSTFELEELNEEDAANKSSRERVATSPKTQRTCCVLIQQTCFCEPVSAKHY